MAHIKNKSGAVLIEVLVSLFITAMVFVTVYTTISVSLVNTRYLQQARETSGFASQVAEAFSACADSDAYTIFDYISETYTDVPGATEIDLNAVQQHMNTARMSGPRVAHIDDMIDEIHMTNYSVQLFLLSPNSVFLSENSLGTPFGSGIYAPNQNLLTFELRVQKNSRDWGNVGYSIYKERQPVSISYIFQVSR